MILRDMYCSQCGAIRADVPLASINILVEGAECIACGEMTDHLPVANGGIKTRFRQQDWPSDPAFYRGQVRCSPPGCKVAESGEIVTDLAGRPLAERERFACEERRAERREQQYAATDRKLGRTPIVFDAKKATHNV